MALYKTTRHSGIDRKDRITFIAINIGFGDEIMRVYQQHNDTYMILTNTGVIIVVAAEDQKRVVTMYTGDESYIYTHFFKAKNTNIPSWLRKIIKRNVKLAAENNLYK